MALRKILLIQGHPDPAGGHLCNALANAYGEGAEKGGHELRRVRVAALDFPLLRTQTDWQHGMVPDTLRQAQQDIAWAEHLVLFFPGRGVFAWPVRVDIEPGGRWLLDRRAAR